MIIKGVTFTGADDEIHRCDLYKLSDEYPLIEWGILIYPKKTGTARYPSKVWLDSFMKWKPSFVKVAGHLCGTAVDEFFEGNIEQNSKYTVFKRIQLNFRFVTGQFSTHKMIESINDFQNYSTYGLKNTRVIIQYNEINAEFIEILKSKMDHCWPSILFDSSGGKGKLLTEFIPPMPKFHCGYAGGLNPENIGAVLETLTHTVPDDAAIWLDMESGVRTNNQFDLDKVNEVMEQVMDYG